MPPKRKHSSKAIPSSQSTADDDAVSSQMKCLRRADQLFDEEPAPLDDTEHDQPRRSSRAGRGGGGRLRQLHNIESIQTARHLRPSTRNLDIATQDEPVNPMAPGYAEDEQESQIPPWAVESTPPFAEQTPEVQPSFKHSQPGQPFGFKLPSQASTGGTQSTRSYNSRSSSGNPSMFSAPVSQGSSVVSSCPVSECGTDSACQRRDDWDGSQPALPKRLSQLCMLAMAEDHTLDVPQRNSRVHTHSSLSFSGTPVQGQHPVHDNGSPSPPPRLPGLCRTQSFSQLPSTIAKSHTIFTENTGGGLDPGEDDLVIDDVSPSEDDRCAEAVLEIMVTAANLARTIPNLVHSGFKVTTGSQIRGKVSSVSVGEIEDVVAQHHQRNRAPQLPDNTRLLAIHDRQKSKTSCHIGHSEGDALDSLEGPISEEAFPIPLPATSVASGIVPNSNSDPSHLQFYTLPIHDIIERAKQISHCDIASINSFPLHADFNRKAPEYVNEAIAERRSRGLAIPDGWWPQYSPNITKLLWEDHGNWRSALKKKARTFIRDRYEWDPQNRRPINAELAKSLLERGNFLRHGVDTEGHTNNFAHPALSGLIIDFFYMGSSAIASIFPEVFEKEVPRAAVALATTAIKVALDEMVVEGKEVTFKCDVYADVYIDLLGLMAKCDTAPIHRAKTKALRVEWASIGRNGSTTLGMNTGFDVDLD
ncbi:hypothetical protein EDD15DRAFT_2369664 [Pisolithus albus]|nr:hypothetical protein EDD15DRAFT_2369664 [Pisolithus albus]